MPEYTAWYEVPANLRTRTQLAALDLPRVPGGPVRAEIYAHGGDGPKGTFDLYDINESAPSPASARALAAAAARRDPTSHHCQDCGAHTDSPTTPHHSRREENEAGTRIDLCWACLHIHRLREAQYRYASARPRLATDARRWLTEDNAAVLAITLITPPALDSGRTRPPVAATIDAVTPTGRNLITLSVRLRNSRFGHLVPDGAQDLDTAILTLREALAGRELITWQTGELDPIAPALHPADTEPHRATAYTTRRSITCLNDPVASWRAEINPTTGRLIHPRPPGRADRMALLIQRMAEEVTA